METGDLKALGTSIFARIKMATESGDLEEARRLVDEARDAKMDFELSTARWINTLMTALAEEVGEEAVFQAHKKAYQWVTSGRFAHHDEDLVERLAKRAHAWTTLHGIDVDIQEDEEKFTLTVACPTGGRLRASGAYGRTQESHPWSFGEVGMAYYCTHCCSFFEVLRMDDGGYPDWITVPQEQGLCRQLLYKNPQDMPEQYYTRIGRQKR